MTSAIISRLEDDYYSEMKCSLLLQKALKVATTLNDEKMIAFCQKEIKGFKDNPKDFPDYRYGHFNYYVNAMGMRSQLLVPEKLKDLFNIFYGTLAIKQPISELEEKLKENFSEYKIEISDSLKKNIRNTLSLPDDCDLIPYISKSYFKEFIEGIRNIIGKWIANIKDGKNDNSLIINNYGQITDSNFIGQAKDSNISIEKVFTTDFDQYKSALKNNMSDINLSTTKQDEIMSLFSQLQNAILQKNKKDGLSICQVVQMILIGAASNLFADGFHYLIHIAICFFAALPLP